MDVTLLPSGERAVLVEVADLASVLTLEDALRRQVEASAGAPAVVDVVPAARTLLVTVAEPGDLDQTMEWVARIAAACTAAEPPTPTHLVTLDVVYDGPDLADVADHTGLSVEEVVARHTGQVWRVAFGGFAPGFAYLTATGTPLVVPRRAEPRSRVPAGAVALAGEYSGVYPQSSPGGWQLIGHTDAVLWDVDRDPPALLRPGVGVQFRAVSGDEVPRVSGGAADVEGGTRVPQQSAAVDVLAVGRQVLLTDLGRPGYASLGVSPSGAADRRAHILANRIVGNPDSAATLEVVFGGLVVQASAPMVIALTGAMAVAWVNGEMRAYSAPVALAAGDILELEPPEAGRRTYLAVLGGWDVPPSLGSRASDTLSRLGPAPVAAGTRLQVGPAFAGPAGAVAEGARPPVAGDLTLEFLPGPRTDWLAEPRDLAGPWTVSDRGDRVGVRLTGTPLLRAAGFADAELASEGVVRGSVQVPSSGLPVIFGADHPVTGGYPVVAVLTEESSDLLAQARPGQTIHLVPRHQA